MDERFQENQVLDHAYDGIKEYDNPLPRWWVTIFALSILFVLPYVLYYHVGIGPSMYDMLDAENARFAERLLATYGELQPDQATILTFMHDEDAMAGISGLFKGKCAQCHLADGSGNVGPNLTDDRWINVKSVTDISDLIETGLVTKGMPAWGERLTETQIVLLSSYVARLRNNPVEGKAPEGEPLEPWPDPPPAAAEERGDTPAADGEGQTAS